MVSSSSTIYEVFSRYYSISIESKYVKISNINNIITQLKCEIIILLFDDIIFNKAIIDRTSLDIISGSVVDFKKEMISESFTITNPKATSSCGCGLSFSI